jgi:hypothetical protein
MSIPYSPPRRLWTADSISKAQRILDEAGERRQVELEQAVDLPRDPYWEEWLDTLDREFQDEERARAYWAARRESDEDVMGEPR